MELVDTGAHSIEVHIRPVGDPIPSDALPDGCTLAASEGAVRVGPRADNLVPWVGVAHRSHGHVDQLVWQLPGGIARPTWSLHDRVLDVDCGLYLFADGVWRCAPAGGHPNHRYADPACTEPAMYYAPSNRPEFSYLLVRGAGDTCGGRFPEAPPTGLLHVGEALDVWYWLDETDGSCTRIERRDGEDVPHRLVPVPLDSLESFHRVVE